MKDRLLNWAADHEFIAAILVVIGALFLIFFVLSLVLSLVFTPLLYVECRQKADMMDVGFNYKFWSGCYFEVAEGQFIHEDYYRGIETL